VNNYSKKIYITVSNFYVRGGLVDESLSHFKNLNDMDIVQNPPTYNEVMSLHINSDQVITLPEMLAKMEN